MINRKKLTSTFSAQDESGLRYQLAVYAEMINAGTINDPYAEIEGLKQIVTSDGQHVNRLGKGKYEVVQSGVRLTSDDPNAF